MYGRLPYMFANESSVPSPILVAIRGILRSWDMATTDHRYLDHFHPDGVLHVGAEPTKGAAAMKKLHDDMVDPQKGPVVHLQHFCDRVFLMPTQRLLENEYDGIDSSGKDKGGLATGKESERIAVPTRGLMNGNDKIEAVYTGKLISVLKTKESITTDFATWIVLSPVVGVSKEVPSACEVKGDAAVNKENEKDIDNHSKPSYGELRVEYLRVFSDTAALVTAISKVETDGE
ncbi:hypothetical protein A1O1_02114 [Capronia coronata CBS 617.96]|uniref:Uncharacterized protein n=1 Tax=Capronia coronata CBS 617.96 TaxID=1182541 RepID=W9YWR3_9EURO|nr:uncharacterized protein A1O1_02114 [Capronia coronata CBS 617.96]EXJ93721.1 hypothetical protein A1O1_02114 [Capronia coronata CBS 617.96]